MDKLKEAFKPSKTSEQHEAAIEDSASVPAPPPPRPLATSPAGRLASPRLASDKGSIHRMHREEKLTEGLFS